METSPQYDPSAVPSTDPPTDSEPTSVDAAAASDLELDGSARELDASDTPEGQDAAGSLPIVVSDPVRKDSIWRRITMRGAAQKAEKANVQQDLVKSRLDGITLRLESIENTLNRSDEKLDERLARLWEIEEQLESLQDLGERATEARDASLEAASAARRASAVAGVAALLAGLAVLAAVASVVFPELSL